jgi:TolA-binding protein
MAQTPITRASSDSPRFSERLSLFLHRGRFVFWTVFGAAAVFLVGYFVYLEVDRGRKERATILVEEAAGDLETWKAETGQEERNQLEQTLTERLDLIGRKYPRQYAAQRAAMIRAAMHVEAEKWEQAAAVYRKLADTHPRSYLAPVALFNAAVNLEEAKDEAGAIEAYGRIVAAYPGSYLAPRALFSRGRLHEATGEIDAAKADYTELSDSHPASGWTRIAKNRILTLQIKGR